MTTPFDLFIIGGGINGCGIARDAAGRGLSVCLAEQGDLASGTSSGSTKLIHGGLRYLEYYEFALVRKALMEREVLWRMAPHIIKPLRFVLPHHKSMRPAWLLRLGLFLYDHLGGRKLLPGTRAVNLESDAAGVPLKPLFKKGFEYSDGWVDDARLVVLNARDAADRGAEILTRTKVVGARREGGLWTVETEDQRGTRQAFKVRVLINAAGPWVDVTLRGALGKADARNVRLVKGSHVVVPRMFDHERCYIFQNADGRIFFAIPYEEDFTLIGTTDQDHDGDPGDAVISAEETDYLIESANGYFRKTLTPKDVVWRYSAVRPLFDDGATAAQEATRDYVVKVENGAGKPPLINIFGGKITTYRRLAEAVVEKADRLLGRTSAGWTATKPLPGGDFPVTGYDEALSRLTAEYPFLKPSHAKRLLRCYGTRARNILDKARTYDDLGRHFGGTLCEAEVTYLVENEWARTAEDILWRRTKEGLRLSAQNAAKLDRFIANHKTAQTRRSHNLQDRAAS